MTAESRRDLALVTGAAGGIGEACARLLAARCDLVLTDVDGKEASATADILLTRTGLTGAPPDSLENGIAPPPPIPMRLWKKVALAVLGLLSFIIMLSFMIPKKFEWGVTTLGLEEQAEFLGLLEPKNGTKQGWTRTIVATGTQTVKRFLTGHR